MSRYFYYLVILFSGSKIFIYLEFIDREKNPVFPVAGDLIS